MKNALFQKFHYTLSNRDLCGWNAGVNFRIDAKRFITQQRVHHFNPSMKVVSENSIYISGKTGSYILQMNKSDLTQFQKSNIEDYSYGLNSGIDLESGLFTLVVFRE